MADPADQPADQEPEVITEAMVDAAFQAGIQGFKSVLPDLMTHGDILRLTFSFAAYIVASGFVEADADDAKQWQAAADQFGRNVLKLAATMRLARKATTTSH